jgi:hypothetical protein
VFAASVVDERFDLELVHARLDLLHCLLVRERGDAASFAHKRDFLGRFEEAHLAELLVGVKQRRERLSVAAMGAPHRLQRTEHAAINVLAHAHAVVNLLGRTHEFRKFPLEFRDRVALVGAEDLLGPFDPIALPFPHLFFGVARAGKKDQSPLAKHGERLRLVETRKVMEATLLPERVVHVWVAHAFLGRRKEEHPLRAGLHEAVAT